MKPISNKLPQLNRATASRRGALVVATLYIVALTATWGRANPYQLKSPSGAVSVQIEIGAKMTWSVKKGDQQMIEPSAISLQLVDGTVLGENAKVLTDKVEKIDAQIEAVNCVRSVVSNHYNQITLTLDNDFGVIFRAYDDAVAYRLTLSSYPPESMKR